MKKGEEDIVEFDNESTMYFRELETGDPDQEYFVHVIKKGDRLDKLAYEYYGDVEKFYLIADANTEIIDNVLEPLPIGEKILIPKV